eukprot:g13917.t1
MNRLQLFFGFFLSCTFSPQFTGVFSKKHFNCGPIDRISNEGQVALVECEFENPYNENTIATLTYFAHVRRETYALGILKYVVESMNVGCTAYTAFFGDDEQEFCRNIVVPVNISIDNVPRLLVVNPKCMRNRNIRKSMENRLKGFDRVDYFQEFLTDVSDMLLRYNLPGSWANNIATSLEARSPVIRIPTSIYMAAYWSNRAKSGKTLPFLSNRERLTYKKYSILYRKYAEDLVRIRAGAKLWLKQIQAQGCTGQYDDIESEIQYIRIREFKPERTLEMSCRCGWSTYWILSALHDNMKAKQKKDPSCPLKPKLWSYDLLDDVLSLPLPDHLKTYWHFTAGDARETVMNIYSEEDPLQFDYFFIDSNHSQNFARDYVDHFLDRQRGKLLAGSIHDVYADHEGRWGPSEEGIVVLEWIALLPNVRSSHVFTVSSAREPHLHFALNTLRSKLGIAPLGALDSITRLQEQAKDSRFQIGPKSTMSVGPSPTLFFDITRS